VSMADRIRLMETEGTIKRIHVNKHKISGNIKNGTHVPAITVQTSAGPVPAESVHIHGSSSVVYPPNKQLSCGARVWIETKAMVTINGD